MPYTYPPASYENLSIGLQYPVLRDLVWWMNGTHPTLTNDAPWQVIDCWDNLSRVQPTSGLLSNLPGGNRWKPGEPAPTDIAANAWVVMQAPPSDVTIRFQVMFKFTGGSTSPVINFYMFWLDDFDVNGAGTTLPTLPTARTQVNSFGLGNTTNWKWNLTMDEGTVTIMVNPSTISDPQWFHFGEVSSVNPESLDPRPFVCSNSWTSSGWPTGFNGTFRGISAVDNTTVISVLGSVDLWSAMDYTGSNDQDAFTSRPLSRVSFHGNSTNHRYSIGFGRNVGALSKGSGTINHDIRYSAGYTGSDYRFIHMARTYASDPRVVTVYSPGTALDSHDLVQEESVPSTLIPDAGGGGDTIPPVVTFINPQPNTTIRSNTVITLSVTDESGAFSGIQLRVSFPTAGVKHATETIHGGDVFGNFEPFYQNCTVVEVHDGWQFTLERVNPDPNGSNTGWPGSPTFTVTPVDGSGNTV